MRPGQKVFNKPCSKCGTNIPIAIVRRMGIIICNNCFEFVIPSAIADPHTEDDLSGYSGSWDNTVKIYEG